MLSGSRRCLGIETQISTLTNHPFKGPLLFLYPRWFRTAAPAHQHTDRTFPISPRSLWLDLGQAYANESPNSNNTSSRHAWSDLSRPVSQISSIATKNRVQAASTCRNGNRDIRQESQAELASPEEQWRPLANASISWDRTIANRQRNETGAPTLSSMIARVDLSSKGQTENAQHYEPRLKIRRPRTPAYRQVLAKSPEPNAKIIKKEATKLLHDPAGMEWSEPIRMLARLIHRPKRVLGERLELHTNTVYHLSGSVKTNAWFHQVGWGCEVRVVEERASDPGKLVVILHGMPRARRLTREYLLEVDRDIAHGARWHLSHKDDIGFTRFLLSSLRWHDRTKDIRRADMVEYPQFWTVRSFADLVETLTTMQIPRQLQRELYEGTTTHNLTVAQVLESLFSDPRSAPFISSRALNDALAFTCKHTEVGDTSNFLFEKAKSLGLSLQADTFNILIEGSLRQNKLDYYRSLLADMQRMGVVPNGLTWVALLRITKSRSGRRAILQHLRQKWPENTILWQQVAVELVSTDFAHLVRLEDSFHRFVDFMDHSFPSPWLSAGCINRMLNVCAEKKLWHIVPRVLELGEKRGGYFNTTTQTLLLKVFQKRGSVRDSVDLLKSHLARTVGRDSAYAIPMIFMTAWNSRFYNVCRVLWRYAAVHGYITSIMQNVVASSLIKNNCKPSDSKSHLWRITAGKVIVGMDLDTTGLGAHYHVLNQEGLRDPMRVLAQWTPDDGPRQEQLALAYTIMQRDLTAYKRFGHFRSQLLFDLLRKAYEMDCEWMHNKKVRRYSDLSWMIESAIDVPLQPLANSNVSPQHLLRRNDHMLG